MGRAKEASASVTGQKTACARSAWGRDGVSARRCGERNRNSTGAAVAQKTHVNSGNTRGKWRDVTCPVRGLLGERHGERARRDWGRERGSAKARRKSTRRNARAQKDAEAAGVRTGAAGARAEVGGGRRERGAREGGGARAEMRRASTAEMRRARGGATRRARANQAEGTRKARGKSGDAQREAAGRGAECATLRVLTSESDSVLRRCLILDLPTYLSSLRDYYTYIYFVD